MEYRPRYQISTGCNPWAPSPLLVLWFLLGLGLSTIVPEQGHCEDSGLSNRVDSACSDAALSGAGVARL